ALVGVLDPFWDEKGYVTGQEYSRFCNALVPLARMRKRVFTAEEMFEAVLDVANFGPADIDNAHFSYVIQGVHGTVYAPGQSRALTIPIGNDPISVPASLDLSRITKAQACKFIARISAADGGLLAENDWDIWIYPKAAKPDPGHGLKVSSSLGD